jgi:hypothetical protein
MFSCYDPEIANPAVKMDEYRLDRKNNSNAPPSASPITRT